MKKILTITFSPCIDKSATVPALVPDKKLRCSAPRFEPGGGGINVARAFTRLGGAATAIYPAGGCSGKRLTELLEAESVDSRVVNVAEETRENFMLVDQSTGLQYRLGMPAGILSPDAWSHLLDQVHEVDDYSFLIVSGSLPPGFPANLFTRLAAEAQRREARLIVDSSGPALKAALANKIYLAKPNLGELAALEGKEKLERKEVVAAAKKLITENHCEIVVVSMGPGGAMLVSRDGCETVHPPPVRRVSTVGAGDSMVAGIVYQLALNQSLSQALRFGVACGTGATLQPGTGLFRKEDAESIFQDITLSQETLIEFNCLSN